MEAMPDTALGVILRNCKNHATKTALHWLDKECEVVRKVSYGELECATRKLAVRILQEWGTKKGERVVLCYPPGLDFIEAFLSCLRAGAIAVPVSPPNPCQSAYTTETLIHILFDCGAACVLTSDRFLSESDSNLDSLKQQSAVPWYSTTTTTCGGHDENKLSAEGLLALGDSEGSELLDSPGSEDIPFLQYSSGSTGSPKGVMPSHASLLHNLQLMEAIMKTDSSMIEISFLPHFHDMGLICSYLQTLYTGGSGYFMSPFTFVENPGLWIKAFSRYRGTHAKAPNFAFELVLRKGFPKDIDLSSLRYITNGSEPVSMETISQFESTLVPYGLKRNAVRAGYGLAEHTVFLCGAQEEAPAIIKRRISCGRPISGVTIKAVNPETCTEVSEGEEAEIWVHSGSNALGYWEKENETQVTFEAQLAGDAEKTYLRTGDLGFIKDGQVFVSGRLKDLIVIHGRNIHPNDVELRIESLMGALRPGRSAAFEYESTSLMCGDPPNVSDEMTSLKMQTAVPSKAIGYVAELRSPEDHTPSELHSLAEEIAATITLDFQVEVATVAFIRPRTLPRTTSGKRQRSLCKKQLVEGAHSEVYRWMPLKCGEDKMQQMDSEVQIIVNQIQLKSEGRVNPDDGGTSHAPARISPQESKDDLLKITTAIGSVLGFKLDPDSSVWAYGCSSLKAVQISQRLQMEFGFSIKPHLLFTHQTPRALLELLQTNQHPFCLPSSTQQSPFPPACHKDDDIAIVGMACSFAGCSSPSQLWDILTRKQVAVSPVHLPEIHQTLHGAFTRATAVFDFSWFGISEWEASMIDPQQSLLLHTTWECLHNAGHSSVDQIRGSSIGVFVGVSSSDARVLGQTREPLPPGTSFVSSIAANRISYTFDFTGPSVAIDTACAASLSALHAACTSLKLGECYAALVGGVNALLDPNGTILLANMGMLSPDGKCRVFDAGANGYVRGEGCGVVLLKRLSEAEKDGSRILAVIKSTATNHNGASATLTSPNGVAQQRLLEESLKLASLQPEDISYIEAHGTGTKMGDPIEVDAIREVFGAQNWDEKDATNVCRKQPLVLGSVKANIGHLETGAGIAGLIKTILVLEHARAPGNPNLEELNPSFCFSASQISIPKDSVKLEECYNQCSSLLYAGVNSFGFGGTNANAILQQYNRLPHMANVKCSLLFTSLGCYGETPNSGLLAAVELLNSTLLPFKEAYDAAIVALNKALKSFASNLKQQKHLDSASVLQHPVVCEFILHYSIAMTLKSYGVKINLAGSTSLPGELAMLVLSDILVLSDAMRLLLMGLAPGKCNVQQTPGSFVEQPAIPLISHTLGKVCTPGELPRDYLAQVVTQLQRGELQKGNQEKRVEESISRIQSFKPTLCVLVQHSGTPKSRQVKSDAIFLDLYSSVDLMEQLREKFLLVRQLSDDLAIETCSERPSKEVLMPKFYERYPMRAVLDRIPASESQPHQPNFPLEREMGDPEETKTIAGSEVVHHSESGYLTQTASLESMDQPPTPANTPVKATLPPFQLNSTAAFVQMKSKIVSELLEVVKTDLDDPNMPVEEAAGTNIFALGLDSLNLMEMRDYVTKSYGISMGYAELIELETIQDMAEAILKANPTLLPAEKQPEALVRHSDSNKATTKVTSPYPLLTKQGYYTIPSAEDLATHSPKQLECVEGFTVGRRECGKIMFLGNTNIAGLNLDNLMSIEPLDITVRRNSDQPHSENLNKPALVFFENALPPKKTEAAIAAHAAALRKFCDSLSMPAQFVYYDAVSGEFVMKVDHFY